MWYNNSVGGEISPDSSSDGELNYEPVNKKTFFVVKMVPILSQLSLVL